MEKKLKDCLNGSPNSTKHNPNNTNAMMGGASNMSPSRTTASGQRFPLSRQQQQQQQTSFTNYATMNTLPSAKDNSPKHNSTDIPLLGSHQQMVTRGQQQQNRDGSITSQQQQQHRQHRHHQQQPYNSYHRGQQRQQYSVPNSNNMTPDHNKVPSILNTIMSIANTAANPTNTVPSKSHRHHHYHNQQQPQNSVDFLKNMQIIIQNSTSFVGANKDPYAAVSASKTPNNVTIQPDFNKTLTTKNTNHVIEQIMAAHAKATTVRSKNEEAIYDLKSRIPEIENIFDIHNRIGNGTFSTVLLGTLKKERDLPEGRRRKFAIKHHVPTSHPDRIMKELQCMAKIGGSNNVVGINCCIRYNESVAFIMPYLAHDRFHDFYHKMDVAEVQFYLKNLLIALRHVHKFNVIHRDVKPSNFLYNRQKKQFLLVDFGLAQQVPQCVLDNENGVKNGDTQGKSRQNDGKRLREKDDDIEVDTTNGGNSNNDAENTKRIRYSPNFTAEKGSTNSTQTANDGNGKCGTGSGYVTRSQNKPATPQTTKTAGGKRRQTGGADITSKCNCYGNPQVCNVCLVKKEIHASRAGTPGYRPPEVLLKYPDQTTAVDIWAVGVIFLSILSSVYPFFKAPNDHVALAEMITIFGDRVIRKTAYLLDRLVTLNQRTKPLNIRKLCVRFRNRAKYSSSALLKVYQKSDGTCEVCKNCDQFFFNCLCADSKYPDIPGSESDDVFPDSAYDLLQKLLAIHPHNRITAEEALKHPFLNENSQNQNEFKRECK